MAIMGQQIGQKLIDALGLPKNTVSFELRCAVNEAVTVRCEYFPEGEEAIDTLINDYQLIAVGGTIRPKKPSFDEWLRAKNEAAHKAMIQRHADLSRMDARHKVLEQAVREVVRQAVQSAIATNLFTADDRPH